MPHLIIELSDNLAIPATELLSTLNQQLDQSGHFKEVDIKSRLYRAQASVVGTQNTPRAFVHATLKIMPGRSTEIRQELAQTLLQQLELSVNVPTGWHLCLSAEVLELEIPHYAKLSRQH